MQMLLFADGIVMVTGKKDDMQRNLDKMKKVMDKWGMKIHWGTKVMIVSRTVEE